MMDELIQNATRLMREQTVAYQRLTHACEQLSAVLINGEPEAIESLTRVGEGELLKMRSRLVQLMSALSSFADARAGGDGSLALAAETRTGFREASNELLHAAREFQRIRGRAAALATNGATFATSGIERCGVPPITYRAPYARRGEGAGWA
jgi:hypothetical protein